MKRIDELSYEIYRRLIDGTTIMKREYYRNLERGDLGHKDVAHSSGPLGEEKKSLVSDKTKEED